MQIKVFTVAQMPEHLQQAWLQHLRDFDIAHPDCHFEVMLDAPNKPLADMIEMLRVTPGLNFEQIFKRERRSRRPRL